jgi:hypothetical protein
MTTNRVRAILALVLVVLASPAALFAAAYDSLLPLLVDLAGWKADPADGIDLSAAGMAGVTVVREYASGDKGFTATIMLGAQVGVVWAAEYREGFKLESTDGTMEVRKINGFLVYHVYDPDDASGGIVVLLLETATDKPGTGAVFVISFDGMPLDEAVKTAQKFDWKKMKDAAARVK